MAMQQKMTTAVKTAAEIQRMQMDVAVIRCEGEMGEKELANIGEMLFRQNRRGCSKVVMDLTHVTHVDYRGLSGLMNQVRPLRASGGDLKIAGMSPYLAMIFRAAGFEEAFEIYESVDDAKRAFLSSLYCVRH